MSSDSDPRNHHPGPDRPTTLPSRPGSGDRPSRPGTGDRPSRPGTGDRPSRPGTGDRPSRPGTGDRPSDLGVATVPVLVVGVARLSPTLLVDQPVRNAQNGRIGTGAATTATGAPPTIGTRVTARPSTISRSIGITNGTTSTGVIHSPIGIAAGGRRATRAGAAAPGATAATAATKFGTAPPPTTTTISSLIPIGGAPAWWHPRPVVYANRTPWWGWRPVAWRLDRLLLRSGACPTACRLRSRHHGDLRG